MTIVVVTTFIFIMATTIAIAITGIILIEGIYRINIAGLPIIFLIFIGTIVTVGTIIFCGCLLSVWILIGMFVIVCAAFYYGTWYFHHNLQYTDLLPDSIKRIRSFFQHETVSSTTTIPEEDSAKKID